MSTVTINRLDAIKAQEAEWIKAAGGDTAPSTDESLVDPKQSISEDSKRPLGDEADLTAGQDATKSEVVLDLDYWKKRAQEAEFRFGKYKAKTDATIFELRSETKTLRENILGLTERVTIAESKLTKDTTNTDQLFSQEVVDILGSETVDALRGVIAKTNERVDKAEAKVKETETKQLTDKIKRDEMEAYEAFVRSLEVFVPDARAMNSDDGFLTWLAQHDVTGTPRLTRLQSAQKIGDIERVASFFFDYKKTLEPVKQDIPKNPNKDTIASRVGPVQKSSSSDVKKESPEQITVSFIRNFEADVARGKYKGRETEKRAITAKIDQAYMSGNIVT